MQGRAEVSRLICEEAQIPYKNDFVSGEEWAKLKIKTPFGQLPLLTQEEDPNFALAQSMTIARYLAHVGNLTPKDLKLSAYCDMLVDAVADFRGSFYKASFSPNRDHDLKDFAETKLKDFLQRYDAFLQKSPSSPHFFVGTSLSWADIVIFDFLDEVSSVKAFDYIKWDEMYPKLKQFKSEIEERPALKAYLHSDRRPQKVAA